MSSHLFKMVPLIFIFFNSSLVFGGVHFRKIGRTTLGRSIAIQRPMKNLPACMLNCERTADCEFVGVESDLCELLGAGDTKLTYMQVYQKIPVGQSSPTFVQTTKTTLTQITTTQGTTTTTKTPTTTTTTKASTLSKETPTDLPSTEAPTTPTTTTTAQETGTILTEPSTTATEVTTTTTEPTTPATSITTEATTTTSTTTEATTITNVPTTTTKLPTTIKASTKTTQAIVTTTEQTTVSYNCPVYYTGSDCSTVKDISVILNEWCQNTHAGTLARYDAVQNNVTYDWACYSPSALTHDAHFWQEDAQGGVYLRGASELYDLVNNHPLTKDKVYMSAQGRSCTNRCSKASSTCANSVETVNSSYFFFILMQTGNGCTFDRTLNGPSYATAGQYPRFDKMRETCEAFVNTQWYSCTYTHSDYRLLCQCN